MASAIGVATTTTVVRTEDLFVTDPTTLPTHVSDSTSISSSTSADQRSCELLFEIRAPDTGITHTGLGLLDTGTSRSQGTAGLLDRLKVQLHNKTIFKCLQHSCWDLQIYNTAAGLTRSSLAGPTQSVPLPRRPQNSLMNVKSLSIQPSPFPRIELKVGPGKAPHLHRKSAPSSGWQPATLSPACHRNTIGSTTGGCSGTVTNLNQKFSLIMDKSVYSHYHLFFINKVSGVSLFFSHVVGLHYR